MSYLAVFAFRSIFVCGVPRYDLRGAHVAFVVARRMFGQGGIKLLYSIDSLYNGIEETVSKTWLTRYI